MISTFLIVNLASAALAAVVNPLLMNRRDVSITIREHAPFLPRSLDAVTENVAVLSSSIKTTRSSQMLKLLRRDDKPIGQTDLQDLGGLEYITNITIDGKDVTVVLDTGSSDLFVPAPNITCVDENKKPTDLKNCGFGNFRFEGTPSGGWIPDVHMHLMYGANGEFGYGQAGYAKVSFAGIEVPKQEIAVIDTANWNGDGITSGLVGLGYPLNTNSFKGTNVSADSAATHLIYDPLLTTIMKTNPKITSFSMAQPKTGTNAYLAFGGLPPVDHDATFAKTPIRTAEVMAPALKGQYLYYIVYPDAWVYDGNPAPATPPTPVASGASSTELLKQPFAIVDCGTTDIYVPTSVYTAVSKLYNPPVITNVPGQGSTPHAPCDATPPNFGVMIGGTVFNVSKENMFFRGGKPVDVSGTKYCPVSIRDGGPPGGGNPFVLGYAFLRNLVTVYDIGAAEIRFAALK